MVKPWRNLGELAGITLALHRLAVGRCGCTNHCDAGVAGKSGHGRAADEGIQAMFVSGQDSNCFQTGQLTGGLQLPVQETEHQLPQMLCHTTNISLKSKGLIVWRAARRSVFF